MADRVILGVDVGPAEPSVVAAVVGEDGAVKELRNLGQRRNQEGPNDPHYYQCQKCKKFSGDDWSQCKGWCPVEDSPSYAPSAAGAFGPLVKMTKAEMLAWEDAFWNAPREPDDEMEVPF